MKKSFLILFVVFVSCSTDKLPENVFSREEMVKILIEVHLLEAKIQKLYVPRDSSEVLYRHYENKLFDELGVDKERYNKSMIYYVDNGLIMSEIYEQVVDSLLLRQKTFER